jgi:circadian clock protein KaiC
MAREHKARILIIDPVSALSKTGNVGTVHGVAERLIDWAKMEGITLLCTSLLDGTGPAQMEGTPIQISTIADTWIHLNYIVNAGERNRGISIVKSRGTSHSNQVRELILSGGGITLADAYMVGGEVLMGTLRWEKERAERNAQSEAETAVWRQRNKIENDAAELKARIKSLQYELELKDSEKETLLRTAATGAQELSERQNQMRGLRRADEATPVRT